MEELLETAETNIGILTQNRAQLRELISSVRSGILSMGAAEGDASETSLPVKELTQNELLDNAIEEVLTEEQPLHRNLILDGVKEKGVHMTAANPLNTLSQRLTLSERFLNVSKGTWALVDYIPNVSRAESVDGE